MKSIYFPVLTLIVCFLGHGQKQSPLSFKKQQIAAESFESVGVFDVDNDKVLDLVSGAYWYQGPEFLNRYTIAAFKRYGEYYDDFSTLPLDVNKDGFTDYVTGGWFSKRLVWMENPKNTNLWTEHLIDEPGHIESTRLWDMDGDGTPEVIPNTPNDSLKIYRLLWAGLGRDKVAFERIAIYGKHGHGIGFGDINGDHHTDILLEKGWLESPKKPFSESWSFHPDFDFDRASVPMIVTDVNQDGLPDIIVGNAHDYGLQWMEQQRGKNDEITWRKHMIDTDNSQFHTMEWVDLDNDGKNELVTGKRYRAHNGKDPGSNDPYGLYYYQFIGESFSKRVIDYGTFGTTKGTGIHFNIIDLNNNGWKDIVVAGKDGLFVYYNQGPLKKSQK